MKQSYQDYWNKQAEMMRLVPDLREIGRTVQVKVYQSLPNGLPGRLLRVERVTEEKYKPNNHRYFNKGG